MPITFFTGFPGFLGSALLPRVLARSGDLRAVCLVQPRFLDQARSRVTQIEAAHPDVAGRIELVEGDITRPGLDLAARAPDIRGEVVEIWHLAAVYDLSVTRELGMRVNVDGTRHMLEFAAGCPGLGRFQYVSTCYVSGSYPAVFYETDLQRGQVFNNFYEETKYLAEVAVQERMAAGLPVTIYRPSVVVGDSDTGATQKYDGPYFIIRYVLRSPKIALLPMVGNPKTFRANTVPRDFVVRAIDYLSGLKESEGKVYALADPNPLTIAEITQLIGETTGRRVVTFPVPMKLAKAVLARPTADRLTGIPPALLDYFAHPTHYDTTRASADLAGSGISCPSFRSYVDKLVEFVKAHPEFGSAAMV
ncbi:MAG TPA: SDR family oxidoreductase [Mycobacteriales bacterium]|nr:SDR family oxidoreductase [Mycobacteriales bacterium]